MPLLHRKPFIKKELPSDLKDDEEIFYCSLTNEVFREYEEYFERTILCNSLVWSCSLTGKCNLTYQEALDCEDEATKKINDFPKSLERPLMYLVGLVEKSRIDDLSDDIFQFVKNRYFVGEYVCVRKKKFIYKVVSVFLKDKETMNGHAENGMDVDEDDDDIPLASLKKSKNLKPDEVSYQLVRNNVSTIVAASDIRRPSGCLNRERCKLFLKLNCYQEFGTKGIYIVKSNVAQRLNLKNIKWKDIYTGHPPVFKPQSPRNDKSKKLTPSAGPPDRKIDPEKMVEMESKEDIKKKIMEMRKKQEQEKEEKKREKEEQKKKKMEEAERIKQIMKEERERKKKERDEELRIKREKIKEDKRINAEKARVWNKPRDDLHCDDLKVLPEPKEINTEISQELFGSVLSLMEFIYVFEDLFDAKDEFPHGVTIDMVEKALLDQSHEGAFCDFLFFFLSNIFRTHIEEEGDKFYELEAGDKELAERLDTMKEENIAAAASLAATWPENYQGFPIHKLELDSYTVTEILRLYLIFSAARPPSDNRMWRYQQRGGYSYSDEIPMRFCINNPDIIKKLSTTCVFHFTPREKIDILLCLADHLLTFVTAREFMEEMSEKLNAAQQAYREDTNAEKRREKDGVNERIKWKNNQAALIKEARAREVERKVRAAEGKKMPEEDESNKENENEENDDSKKIYTPAETIEYLKTLDEEEKEAKDAFNFRSIKHQQTISKLRKNVRIKHLGQDRYYRRYWAINCMPGIFVEEFEDPCLTDDFLQIKVAQITPPNTPAVNLANGPYFNMQLNNTNIPATVFQAQVSIQKIPELNSVDCNDNKTIVNGKPEKIALSDSLEQHRQQGKANKWYIYETDAEIDSLLQSLNGRGHRELRLKSSINHHRLQISNNLQKFTVHPLNLKPKKTSEPGPVVHSHAFELAFRDLLLEFEERIWFGTLGILNSENRDVWKMRLTNGEPCAPEIVKTLITSVKSNFLNDIETEESNVIASPYIDQIFQPKAEVKQDEKIDKNGFVCNQLPPSELAIALLQIERGIDPKYLKEPLGCSTPVVRKTRSKNNDEDQQEKEKMRKRSKLLLARWEKSLIKCTSISQVSLHLTTLDRSIIWSRSLLNASCRICRRKGDAEKMLLCDMCDRGHHMYCLKPALKNVPAGNWFCPDCKPRAHRPSPRKMPRKISFSQNDSSSDEEEEDEENEDTENEATEEETEDDTDSDAETEEDMTEDDEEVKEPTPPRKGLAYKITNKAKSKNQNRNGRSNIPNKISRDKSATRSRDNSSTRGTKRNSSGVSIQKALTGTRRTSGMWKELNICQDILCSLTKHEHAWPFLEPVSKRKVPDYYDIIKNPMDFSTIRQKIMNGAYENANGFVLDVYLVFSNCLIYNLPKSDIVKAANSMRQEFEYHLRCNNLESYIAKKKKV